MTRKREAECQRAKGGETGAFWPGRAMLQSACTPGVDMTPSIGPPRSVRFGNYEFDTRTGELWAENQRVHLQEQPQQILMMLIQRAGDVVTREELHGALWPGSPFGDLEDSLNHAVRRLREALGDTGEEPRFIKTVPRRGYRFIAPVDAVAPVSAPAAIGGGSARPREGRAHPYMRWAIALVYLAILSAAILFALNVAGLRERFLTAVGDVMGSRTQNRVHRRPAPGKPLPQP